MRVLSPIHGQNLGLFEQGVPLHTDPLPSPKISNSQNQQILIKQEVLCAQGSIQFSNCPSHGLSHFRFGETTLKRLWKDTTWQPFRHPKRLWCMYATRLGMKAARSAGGSGQCAGVICSLLTQSSPWFLGEIGKEYGTSKNFRFLPPVNFQIVSVTIFCTKQWL